MLGKELGELDFSLGLLWYDYMMVVVPHNTQGLVLKLFFLYFMEADQQIKWFTPLSKNTDFYEDELVLESTEYGTYKICYKLFSFMSNGWLKRHVIT